MGALKSFREIAPTKGKQNWKDKLKERRLKTKKQIGKGGQMAKMAGHPSEIIQKKGKVERSRRKVKLKRENLITNWDITENFE